MWCRILRISVLAVSTALIMLGGCAKEPAEIKEAREYIEAGITDRAEEILKAEIQKDPKNAAAYYTLGTLYLKLGDEDAAKECFEQALNFKKGLKDKIAQAYYEAGLARLDEREGYEAVELFKEATYLKLSYQKGSAEALFVKASDVIETDRDEGERYLKWTLELNPDLGNKVAEVILQEVKKIAQEGDHYKTTRYLKWAGEADEGHKAMAATISLESAKKCATNGDHAQAIRYVKLAVETDEGYRKKAADICLEEASNRAQEGLHDKAVEYLKSAGEVEANYRSNITDVSLKQASMCLQKGQYHQAVTYADIAIENDPESKIEVADIYYQAGSELYRRGEKKTGYYLLNRAAEGNPKYANDELCYYVVHLDPPKSTPKVKDYLQFLEKFPKGERSAQVAYTLAMRFSAEGNIEKAKEYHNMLLSKYPDSDFALLSKKRMEMLEQGLLFYDDFEGGTSAGWEIKNGKVEDGVLKLGLERKEGSAEILGSSKWTDYVIEVKVKLFSSSANIVFRKTEMGAYYAFSTHNLFSALTTPPSRSPRGLGLGFQREHRFSLTEVSLFSGFSFHDAKEVSPEPAMGVWHDVRIEVKGQEVHCYFNGKMVLHYDALKSAIGGVELSSQGGEVHFDDLKISKIGEAKSLFR